MAAAMAAPQQQPASNNISPGKRKDGSGSGAEGERLPMPSRNPLPLSASQEAQVREVFNARVRRLCADEIQAFADCARNRTLSIPFACRALSNAMNGCMLAHATPEEHDRAREDWFAARAERARERDRRDRRRREQEQFHRDWWGLPPSPPRDHPGAVDGKLDSGVAVVNNRGEGEGEKGRGR